MSRFGSWLTRKLSLKTESEDGTLVVVRCIMNEAKLAMDGLAAALEASGRNTGRSYTEVVSHLSPDQSLASIRFKFPPGWVLPRDVEAFIRELHEQLHEAKAAWMLQPDPRTVKLLDLANRMVKALRQDESALQVAISDGVLRDHWPAGVLVAAARELEQERAVTRMEALQTRRWRNKHDALKQRITSLNRTRAMRVNPVDPRRP